MMDLERCKMHQEKLTEEPVTGYDHCRVPTLTEIKFHYSTLKSGTHLSEGERKAMLENRSGTNIYEKPLYREILNKKRKRDLLEKFECIY